MQPIPTTIEQEGEPTRKGKSITDYPTIREWIENEWHYYALVVGIDDNVFWHLTPKTIQVYFKAYRERRKIAIQDIWLQGKYMACAIASTISFSKGKPPQYPEMPFKEEDEQELAKDPEWVEKQRILVWNQFAKNLGIKEK